MNEHEKTPTVSHQRTISHSGDELDIREPPYLQDNDSSQNNDDAADGAVTAANIAPRPSTAAAQDAPSITIDTTENRMSGLSEEEEQPSTPKSSVGKQRIEQDTINTTTDQVVTHRPPPDLLPITTTEESPAMPPVQEYSVLTNTTPHPTGQLPPRSANKLRSPRLRSVKAVDWCPPSTFSRHPSNSLGVSREVGSTTTPTVVTSRAVRGDDATITTYATMTTMGDAASILEGGEEEESSDEEEEEDELDSTLGFSREQENILLSASVASGISDSVMKFDDRSVLSGMDLGSIYENQDDYDEEDGEDDDDDENGDGGVHELEVPERHHRQQRQLLQVDKLPSMTSTPGTSVISGTTSKALADDRSLLSLGTANNIVESSLLFDGNVVEVDKVPSMTSTPGTSVISGATSRALRDPDDRSLYSLNTTNTTAGLGTTTAYVTQNNTIVEVDKVPSMTSTPGTSVISGTTTQALRDPDDRSLYSLNTTNTSGVNVYDYKNTMVDRTPSNVPAMENAARSFMGDADSDATFSTMNTTGKERAYSYQNHVVDHVPENNEGGDGGAASVSAKTDGAVRNKDDQSVATWNTFTTGAMNDNAVVDVLPSSKQSVVSGTTNMAVNDEQSVATWNTMTTMNTNARDRGSSHVVDHVPDEEEEAASISAKTDGAIRNKDDQSVATWNTFTTGAMNDNAVVDILPTSIQSVVSGTTNMAVNDEQSVATWNTMTTMNTNARDRGSSHVVDHVPDEEEEAASFSAKTDGAIRNKDDQSVATWNTFTTGAMNDNPVVDILPTSRQSVVSGTTNMAVNDEQSVATWNTMTTAGLAPTTVDRIPSLTNLADASISGTTNRAVRAPDDQSVVTFATQTTFGGDRGNRVVDHVPSVSNAATFNESVTSNTEYAIGGSQSVATWTTMNTMGNQFTGNVVDHIPQFLMDDNVQSSSMSAPTTHAVQEDRSVITFATTTTSGERGIQNVVDGIPTFAGGGGRSVSSGITNQAVRMNDDRSVASFNTMTTSGDLGSIFERGNDDAVNENPQLLSGRGISNRDGSEGEEDEIATSVSSSSRPVPSGILREGRHNRPSVGSAAPVGINAGESVSNTHILRAITELRLHVDYRMEELGQANRSDLERITHIIQREQAKRTALESRLHSQLLMQSESMVAMELKLMRLEAKVAHRELHRQRRQPGISAMPVTDRLPPIAATSSPNRSDEEVDSFEELDLTPRANRLGSSSFSQGGASRGPVVVTRSGASVASAVTATSFADGHDEEERSGGSGSEDGDVEDMDDQNDGSVSTPHSGSNNRISNLESILLNPLTPTGTNEQGLSTRAVRGETDGMSSLPTSVTSTTMASTVVTATTRGESVGVGITRMSSRASDDDIQENTDAIHNNAATDTQIRSGGRSIDRFNSDDMIDIDGTQQDHARSRSQSPLTVQSAAAETIGTQSVASVSVVPSILSTAAVASSRSFGTRRANAALAALERNAEGRPLANRVVSFTTNDMEEQSVPLEGGGGDSITMPDELDTFSDVADAFSNSARAWREEYEARLSNLEKRLGN